jgi:NADH:ubiquinone reductase (H+-translocating)
MFVCQQGAIFASRDALQSCSLDPMAGEECGGPHANPNDHGQQPRRGCSLPSLASNALGGLEVEVGDSKEPVPPEGWPRRPRVVIIGAGFGGLAAAKALARAPVDVTLLDRHNHHCFQPLLYQVATAALSPADIAWPIRGILRAQKNARVLMARVTDIDVTARRVYADAIELGYDFLVLATGATHSYFGHDDWADVAPGLKRIEDATKIRCRILIAFERAELINDEEERRRLLTFVIVGAGPTGVEMAGAIAEVARQTLQYDFREIDPARARIVLVEAGPRVLAAFCEELSRYAERSLTKMGVEVRTRATVTKCDSRGVNLGTERLDAGTIIWAAGVVASPAAQWIGAEHDRSGRLKVNPDLSVPGQPNVFAIGDTAQVVSAGRTVPGLAPPAKQMGRYVGSAIAAKIKGKTAAPFEYRDYGSLATIGRRSAVVELGRFRVVGFLGWLFWSVAHVYFLISVRNRLVVAFNWAWQYLTFQRGARLITQEARVRSS